MSLTLISETVLASPAASIDFTSIPATYTHLLFVGSLISAVAGSEAVLLRFNNDSAANYDDQYVRGAGATASAANRSAATSIWIAVTDGTIGCPVEILVPNYARTALQKTAIADSYQFAGGGITALHGGRWTSAVAINRITLLFNSGNNFNTDTEAALYGVA